MNTYRMLQRQRDINRIHQNIRTRAAFTNFINAIKNWSKEMIKFKEVMENIK